MTAYSTLHFMLAGFCLLLACIHFSLWMVERGEAVNGWIAGAFIGFVLLDSSLAGYGRGAGSPLGGSVVPWSLLLIAAVPTAWPLAETIFGVFGQPVRGWRRAFCLGVLAATLLRCAAGVWDGFRVGFPPTWEEFALGPSPTVLLAMSANFAVAMLWIMEALAAIRAGKRLGWLALGAAVPTLAVMAHDVFMSTGDSSLMGLSGLPFLGFASASVAHDMVVAKRAVRAGGDVGRYKLLQKLGAGGMGEIYLAARTGPAGFERHVVVKKMLGSDTEGVERFLSEARLAAQLQHPNIVSVHDMGHLEDGWFLVMEYLPGASLAGIRDSMRRRGGKVPVELVVFAGEQIARGLHHAHEKGIVHRDVSPQNVMATFSGEIKVVDFGIAKESTSTRPEGVVAPHTGDDVALAGSADLTAEGKVLGKLPYLSPERVAGQPATPQADQFALGVTLFELLTLTRPFDPAADLPRKVDPWKEGVPRLEELRADVPPRLARAIERTLARRPSDRFPSLRDLSAELRAIASRLPEIDLPAWLQQHFGEEAARANSAEATLPSPTHTGTGSEAVTVPVENDPTAVLPTRR